MAPHPAERSGTGSSSAAAAGAAGPGLGLGQLLKDARDARGLTIDQAAAETRIRRRYLEALESDRLDALPEGFYQRALLRTYARALHLDERVVLDRLDQAVRPQPPGATRWAASTGTTKRLRGGRALMLAAALVGVVVGARAIGGRPSPAPAAPSPTPAAEPRVPVAPAAVAPAETLPMVPPTPDPPAAAAVPRVTPAPAAPPVEPQPPATTVPPAATPVVEPPPAAPAAITAAEPATPPATARPAEALVGLVLRTEPAGARVTVDGIGWGISPVTIRHLPPGDKRIRVSKEGYATVERAVRIVEGRPTIIDLQLRPLP